MQILAPQSYVIEQSELQAAAGNPTEFVGPGRLGGHIAWILLDTDRLGFGHLRAAPSQAGRAVGEHVRHEQIAGAQAGASERIDLARKGNGSRSDGRTRIAANLSNRLRGRLLLLLVAEAVVDLQAADPSAVLPIVAAAEAEHAALGFRIVEGGAIQFFVGVIRRNAAPAIAAK